MQLDPTHSLPSVNIPEEPAGAGPKPQFNIKQALGKFGDAIHRTGITLTGILPFSSRGIILNLALAPALIPIRMAQSVRSQSPFTDKMKHYMDKDWNQGIQDFDIDLESSSKAELRKQVLDENFRYAGYMYAGLHKIPAAHKHGSLLSTERGNAAFPEEKKHHLAALEGKFRELGFSVDNRGNYYNTETGNMFNLVYDSERNEILICFMGLGNSEALDIDQETKNKMLSNTTGSIAADWLGGIPKATMEAIKIGKILKEIAADAELTPVLVGHSHGGGMAQAGALANGIKGISFNSRPLGAGVRRYIGQSKVAKNAKNLTTFSGKGDWLTGTTVINTLAVLFERLTGIPVPRSVGTSYKLPELADQNSFINHVYFYEAMEELQKMSDDPEYRIPKREGNFIKNFFNPPTSRMDFGETDSLKSDLELCQRIKNFEGTERIKEIMDNLGPFILNRVDQDTTGQLKDAVSELLLIALLNPSVNLTEFHSKMQSFFKFSPNAADEFVRMLINDVQIIGEDASELWELYYKANPGEELIALKIEIAKAKGEDTSELEALYTDSTLTTLIKVAPDESFFRKYQIMFDINPSTNTANSLKAIFGVQYAESLDDVQKGLEHHHYVVRQSEGKTTVLFDLIDENGIRQIRSKELTSAEMIDNPARLKSKLDDFINKLDKERLPEK